jgi:methyl-galactoside transport system ATP-binding protein
VLLRVENLSSKHNHVEDVSFELRRGEIIGLAGLAGAGRTEVIENVFGISERDGGKLYLGDREIKNRTPREAIRNGFALLTEERRATGIFGNLDIRENTTISSLKKHLKLGVISERSRKKDTARAVGAMNVKTASQETHIKLLSGGNQQKVILGRWLLTEPEILMLDEPTRGIDVGAKYEIYQLIDSLAAKGKAVIVVSSELPELLGICDRIYVMSGGRIAGEVDAKSTSQEEIMTLAAKYV